MDSLPANSSLDDAGEEDDGEDFINLDVTTLFSRWRNEKYAPEILPFDTNVVENISELVENAAEILEEERLGGDTVTPDSHPRNLNDPEYCLRSMDLERIKYLLRDYLRIRLWKLSKWPQHYLEPYNNKVLSGAERRFLADYWTLKQGFLDNRLLSALPPFKQGLSDKVDLMDMVRKPQLHKHVYAKILQDLGKLEVPQSLTQYSAGTPEPLQLQPGQTYLLKYSIIRDYLMLPKHAGKVELV